MKWLKKFNENSSDLVVEISKTKLYAIAFIDIEEKYCNKLREMYKEYDYVFPTVGKTRGKRGIFSSNFFL